MDAPSRRRLYCLDPMEGMVNRLKKPEAEFVVEETLWDGGKCGVELLKLWPLSHNQIIHLCPITVMSKSYMSCCPI
jgi:hypothetical protein